MIRPSTDHQRAELKAAVRAALLASGGGDSAQQITRVNASVLSRYGSTDHADTHVPLDVALDLDLDSGRPVLLGALARLQGLQLAGSGALPGSDAPCAMDMIAVLVSEHADLIASIASGNADGHFTETELRALEKEAHELMAAVNAVFGFVCAERAKRDSGA